MRKNLLSIADLSLDHIWEIIENAAERYGDCTTQLQGKSIALLFEKASLRTRVSFDLAIHQLGGHAITLLPQEVGLGVREPVADVAKVLSRFVDGIIARVNTHTTLEIMSENSSVPIINALSDVEHPCQTLADLATIYQKTERLRGLTVAFVGDGNNVSNSLALGCALVGATFRMASPLKYGLSDPIKKKFLSLAESSDGKLELFTNPREAIKGAHVVYTDVWTSMGQELEQESRVRDFQGYTVTESLLELADPECVFLHPLPAHPGEEISPGLLDHPRSVVFDQAENRLHAQRALLKFIYQD